MLFKHSFFKNYIAPKLNNNFKIKDVLKIFADKGIIKINKPSVIVDKSGSQYREKVCYECRRAILDKNGDTLFNGERFVVMDLKYYRTYCELDKAKDNHARSKDHWEIVKDKFNIQRFKKYDELDKSKLINNHVFIAGASGSGKTYFMQKEVMNAVENGKSCIIIDTGNSFSSDELKPELKERIGDKIKIYDVKDTALPLGLFNRKTYTKDNGMTREESANERADRISANLAKTLGMGDTQKVTLLEMIERIKSKDDFINSLYYETKNKLGNSGITMRLRKITNLKFESDETDYWRNILYGEGGNLIIFQLSSLQDEQQKIAADMIMLDLFDYVSNIHSENRAVLVLDEMQKLNTSDKAILITMLRECRKYNLDIWCSTQEPDFGQSNKMIRSIINMAGTKVYFKPPDNDMNKFARFLYGTGSGDFSLDDFKKVIKNMEHGRAIVDIGSNKWDIEKLILIPKIGEK